MKPPARAPAERSTSPFDNPWLLGFSFFAFRLALILLWPRNAISIDLQSWAAVADALGRGENPYVTTGVLNWPPFWMEVIAVLRRLWIATGLDFVFLLKAFLAAGETAALLVATEGLRRFFPGASRGRAALWGFVLNPVAVFLTCQHGNFDIFVGLWSLAAVWSLAGFHRDRDPVQWLWAAAFVGVGVFMKTVPDVLAPLLFFRIRTLPRRTVLLGALLFVGPVLLSLSVIGALSPRDLWEKVILYRSLPGWFGVSGALAALGWDGAVRVWSEAFSVLLPAALVLLAWRFSRRETSPSVEELADMALALFLAVVVLGPGYGPQYAGWFLPLTAVQLVAGTARRRAFVGVWMLVAALTYLFEYAFFLSHGAFIRAFLPTETVAPFLRLFTGRSAQTLLRAPLFLAYAALWVDLLLSRRNLFWVSLLALGE